MKYFSPAGFIVGWLLVDVIRGRFSTFTVYVVPAMLLLWLVSFLLTKRGA